MQWENKCVRMPPLAVLLSRSTWFLVQGFSLPMQKMRSGITEQLHCIDLYFQALHAELMPGNCYSMLQLLPSAGKLRTASVENKKKVKAVVNAIYSFYRIFLSRTQTNKAFSYTLHIIPGSFGSLQCDSLKHISFESVLEEPKVR